ncbi:hypothetical protein WA026_018720 [Henosepilachna vigintioctopunctata]|uniref:MRG domain-containing protein n=1 Tax=Henosepilachna vigintioctopunctata TaxID=420089 RepID=A0AAW1TQH0_9CUCU
MDTDEGQASSSSDDDTSTEEECIPIELTPNLKQLLENDYHFINSNNKLHKLPAVPNVANILETYFKHFSNHQRCNSNEKNGSRYRNYYYTNKPTVEDIQKNLISCREFLDGMRIYFDNTLEDLLLYRSEKNVYPTKQLTYSSLSSMNQTNEQINHADDQSSKVLEENGSQNTQNIEQENNVGASRRKSLRSYNNQESQNMNGNSQPMEAVSSSSNGSKPCLSIASSNSETSAPPFQTKTISWKALPDAAHHCRPPPPCLVYGATHLTRLLVKMPELLGATSISGTKLKNLIRHIELFIDFLNEHKEWYGEKYYQGS